MNKLSSNSASLKVKQDEQLHIIFYDGECGLCNRAVQFFIGIDKHAVLQFAPLQGETAAQLLPADLLNIQQLDTLVYAVVEHAKLVSTELRSNAVFIALSKVEGLGSILALGIYIPRPIRDWCYRIIARHRFRFWRRENCRLPTVEERQRFLP